MRTHVVHLVSHGMEDPAKVLQSDDGELTADHIAGIASFTLDARHEDGAAFAKHRFAVIVVSDETTAHTMELQGDIACSAMDGLTDRFREVMRGIFGDDVVRAVMLQHFTEIIVAHVPGDDDDEETKPDGVLN